MRFLSCLLLAALFLLPEITVHAADADVPHPTLPEGAGAIDTDAAKTFTATASGLQYRILRKGSGIAPKSSSTVKVHYHGWLDDGKVFDSSYKRRESIEFPLSGVIPGWTEGMQLVGKGGMIELLIPAKLGYGKRGAPPVIPPDATLHFLVELLEVR
ncbi:MAG: FKBP-type peptidyl-prolyl cis-trans isomerase [Planctomycetia bacterium]|nr:FKBP-type peptidyl-prolyl cis-trans isomerase [Planctomycetia bacterium]